MTASPPPYSLALFSWLLFCLALVPSACPPPYFLAPFSWLTFQAALMFTLSRENCLKERRPVLFCTQVNKIQKA